MSSHLKVFLKGIEPLYGDYLNLQFPINSKIPCSTIKLEEHRTREPRFENCSRRNLILRGGGFGHDVHAAAVLVELHLAVHERKERPIASRADVLARDELAAALAHDDAARADDLAAKFFYAQPFADAVAPVADAALTFFMCHNLVSLNRDLLNRCIVTLRTDLTIQRCNHLTKV
jgi:hypothetical protein